MTIQRSELNAASTSTTSTLHQGSTSVPSIASTSALARVNPTIGQVQTASTTADQSVPMNSPNSETRLNLSQPIALSLDELTDWMDSGRFESDDPDTSNAVESSGVSHLLRADLCQRILKHPVNRRIQEVGAVKLPGSAQSEKAKEHLQEFAPVIANFRPIKNARNILSAENEQGTGLETLARAKDLHQISKLLKALKTHEQGQLGTFGVITLSGLLALDIQEGIAFIQETGIDIHQDIGASSLLHLAVSLGSVELAEFLIAGGFDIDRKDNNGDTALMRAVMKDSLPLVQTLLNASANINTPRQDGRTPAHMAAGNNHLDVLNLLIQKNAVLTNLDSIGRAPLHWAAVLDRSASIEMLAPSVDINQPGIEGWTALHYACAYGNTEAIKTLLDKGADINNQKEDGYTPLHLAILNNCTDGIKLLRDHGANPRLSANDGLTAIGVARNQWHFHLALTMSLEPARPNR